MFPTERPDQARDDALVPTPRAHPVARRLLRTAGALVLTGATYLGWLLATLPMFWLGAPGAALWLAALLLAFLLVHVRRNLRPDRRRQGALLRLRWPGDVAWRWLVLAAPLVGVFSLAFGALLVYVGAPPADAGGGLPEYSGPLASLPIAMLLVGFAPLVEEFVFRGWIQHRLERLLGAAPAIFVTAAAFALAHGVVLGNVNRFLLGLAFGTAVWASGSIWAGVALHVSNNAAAALAGLMTPDSWQSPRDMIPWLSAHGGLTALAAISALSGGVLFLAVTRLRRSR